MIADTKSWKDKVREASLRAFHHKGEFEVHGTRPQATAVLTQLSGKLGYKFVTRESEGATLIAAKRGALTKLGYISAHLAIVIICIGGLLDSNLPIKLQMWLFDKTPIRSNTIINDIPPEHRLPQTNPTFRGYAWVPEGQHVSTAILNQQDGSLIQDLPFSIELNRFIVDYYSDRYAQAVCERYRRYRSQDRRAHSGPRRSEQAVRIRRRVDSFSRAFRTAARRCG